MRKVLFVALFVVACRSADGVDTSSPLTLPLGSWGGDQSLIVATDSSTQVGVSCRFGTFPGRLPIDAQGRFSATGSGVPYEGVYLGTFPAQLNGQINGNSVTFAIAVDDTVRKQTFLFGPTTVVLGQPGTMGPCPG